LNTGQQFPVEIGFEFDQFLPVFVSFFDLEASLRNRPSNHQNSTEFKVK
jgi:hypothetical protein